MNQPVFETDISRHVWETRYCLCEGNKLLDQDITSTWHRVAHALSLSEDQPAKWEARFYSALEDFHFIPGGRILSGAGSHQAVTLFNCFVMGRIEDSRTGIDKALDEGTITMQQGGGVGYDFSTLRPSGCRGWEPDDAAVGPVALMDEFDDMCSKLLSRAARRGAMMGTLRCDHPDVDRFINAKREPEALRNFNLSLLISDEFMQAVHDDTEWALVYPEQELAPSDKARYPEQTLKTWSGASTPTPCRVFRHVRARSLWQAIMQANFDTAEPGVLFVDRINQLNNLAYRENISATNPCGEIPLPYYGACDLGSINLTRFVKGPFTQHAHIDHNGLSDITQIAVRMLDNVIDLSRYPLEAQRRREQADRRIGLGITGLADTLIMLGHHYASASARDLATAIMETICHSAYRSSIALAREKGSFASLDRSSYLASPFIQALPDDIRQGIAESGIRNSHLIAIAPTGTISLLANNISSGIEPVFRFEYHRRVRDSNGKHQDFSLINPVVRQWQALYPDRPLPDYFVSADQLTPESQLFMQSALQALVDNAISKTINVVKETDFDEFSRIYEQAYALGLKGCTTYRPNPTRGAVLSERQSNE